MSDDIKFIAESRKIESERELLESISARLKEVAGDIQDKYGIEKISQDLLGQARNLDGNADSLNMAYIIRGMLHIYVEGLYENGQAAEAELLTSREFPSFMHELIGKVNRIDRTSGYTQDHIDLYVAGTLVESIVGYDPGDSDKDVRKARILCDILLDEARDLFWDKEFVEPEIIGEQAALKGKILYLRALKRGCEDERLHNIGKEELAGYFKEAADEFEKARAHGKEDEQVLSELASCYADLAKLAEETPERRYYAQEALNVFHVLMPIEGDGFLSCFNRLEMAKMYIALDKPNKAAATLILGAASAGRANIAWLKEGACDEIRKIYAEQPARVERALELVEERQHR